MPLTAAKALRRFTRSFSILTETEPLRGLVMVRSRGAADCASPSGARTSPAVPPRDDAAKVDAILDALGRVESGLIFANLVDFDTRYGHRRDPEGMAENIERFDERLPKLPYGTNCRDLMIITTDYANDPTFKGSDHTRERVLSTHGKSPGESLGSLSQTPPGLWDVRAASGR